ncbi:hypothetical protein L6164_018403 [Bauhinia variegata]|uniref:Uncharacterized protein n=1 Tax=Bauhinia variegata TaxID=167791 RepID=A0ACB9ND51_BAUVA|nr:hypothetical protein L6164_018403 [Bauhinia variegata]
MAKRKSRKKPPPKKRMNKLETVFTCPFCNHGSSVECRLDTKNMIGELLCRICNEHFSTGITDTPNGLMSVNESITWKMKLDRDLSLGERQSHCNPIGRLWLCSSQK